MIATNGADPLGRHVNAIRRQLQRTSAVSNRWVGWQEALESNV
jgi:hypothetical protein